jgi:hypothetical protein
VKEEADMLSYAVDSERKHMKVSITKKNYDIIHEGSEDVAAGRASSFQRLSRMRGSRGFTTDQGQRSPLGR